MATSWSPAAGNVALDALLATYSWVKLHVGQPGATGLANPAIETTRQQATWTAAAGGAASNTGALTWTNVAGSEDYTHFSVWTLAVGGNFGFSGTVSATPVTAGDNFVAPIGDLDASLVIAS
jgi:hypothetical protein